MSADSEFVVRAGDVRSVEHTPGGSVRWVNGQAQGVDLTVGISHNPIGGRSSTHRHNCGEVFVVVEGWGIYTIDGTEVRAEVGDAVFVPANTWHSFRAADESELHHVTAYEDANVETKRA